MMNNNSNSPIFPIPTFTPLPVEEVLKLAMFPPEETIECTFFNSRTLQRCSDPCFTPVQRERQRCYQHVSTLITPAPFTPPHQSIRMHLPAAPTKRQDQVQAQAEQRRKDALRASYEPRMKEAEAPPITFSPPEFPVSALDNPNSKLQMSDGFPKFHGFLLAVSRNMGRSISDHGYATCYLHLESKRLLNRFPWSLRRLEAAPTHLKTQIQTHLSAETVQCVIIVADFTTKYIIGVLPKSSWVEQTFTPFDVFRAFFMYK